MRIKQSTLDSLVVTEPGYRRGRPCLKGTGITVHDVAAVHSTGYTVEQLCAENPDLDPSLFYAALAYYYLHRSQIDSEIEDDEAEEGRLAALYPDGITRATSAPR